MGVPTGRYSNGIGHKLLRQSDCALQRAISMYELHENEQYFFDQATLDHLTRFLTAWPSPCCLCAPMLGKRLVDQGVEVTILDIDERFAAVPGFRRYDIYRPEWLGNGFGIILCDPPFYNVSLSQLFTAIRILSCYRLDQPLLISYLQRRSAAIVGAFRPFGLQPTGYIAHYQTVQASERNVIEFFSNLPNEQIETLRSGAPTR